MITAEYAQELVQQYDQAKSDRANWESIWEECAFYCMPHQRGITSKNESGQKIPGRVYDSTAIQANRLLASGYFGTLTSPSSRWFNFKQRTGKIKSKALADWFSKATETAYELLNGTNFYKEIFEYYWFYNTFGTAIMYFEKDEFEIARFYNRHVKDCFLFENDRGRVDKLMFKRTFKVRQAFQKWGDKAGEVVTEKMKNKKYTDPVDFLFIVEPRFERDPQKVDKENMPFASYWVEVSKKELIQEEGYQRFPYAATRATKLTEDPYGYSTAMFAIADIKTLNEEEKTLLRAGQKGLDPALDVPSGYLMPIKNNPGGINFREQGTERINQLLPNVDMRSGFEMANQKRESVKSGFDTDVFLLPTDVGKMTATEIAERVNQRMTLLSPMAGGIMNEGLDVMLTGFFWLCYEANQFDPLPEGIDPKDIVVEYISPLAKAQRASDLQSLNSLVAALTPWAQLAPAIMDLFNVDEIGKALIDITNVSTEFINDEDEVAAARAERAESQKQLEMMQKAQMGADAYQKGTAGERNLADVRASA